MKIAFYLTTALVFVVLALGSTLKPKAEPPKAKPILKAVLKVQGKPDQQIAMEQLPPKVKNTLILDWNNPPLLPVPAGTLNTPCKSPSKVALKPLKIDPKEHSVLVKKKSTGCGCGNTPTKRNCGTTCTPKRQVQKTCRQNSKTTTCAKRKCDTSKSTCSTGTRCKQNRSNGRGCCTSRGFSFGGFRF